MPPLRVLYEDNHLLAVWKPARVLTIGDESGDETLTQRAKEYIAEKYDKPGKVYLGIVHRLDGPVSGVVLFARTSKAAGRITEQFRAGTVRKVYHAIVEGTVSPPEAVCTDWLLKNPATNVVRRVAPGTDGAKACSLSYRRLQTFQAVTTPISEKPPVHRGKHRRKGKPQPLPQGKAALHKFSLIEVLPTTGRSHQIRVQLASRGYPIFGDVKYGSRHTFEGTIALHAVELTFEHPTLREPLTITAPVPELWQKLLRPR